MNRFELSGNGTVADIVVENNCPEGVKRIAKVVAADIETVTGLCPRVIIAEEAGCAGQKLSGNIIYVCAFSPDAIAGKREVYELTLNDGGSIEGVQKVLRVAGSDKRGLIYGLFAVSEMCGVSPLVWWGDIRPEHRDSVVLTIGTENEARIVSKEPSIEYRGFFINDEWPAFGRWCSEKYGGFTAEVYEQVFLLLLRLKGNYMWPAMWSSTFSEDGPGLASAELADMYGIVMGASHHEPMCRAGEEWQHIYAEYGSDNTWSFISNKEAITAFWRDGINRNKRFENIITIGMRGECDSKLLGEDAGLADNIAVIKDAITTQHRLIRENIDPELSRVPRMLAVYKEVEDYYYGDESCPGLKDWDELDDVIFMLCEDNWGNMRGLPTKEERAAHRGGYGMYYHFDYHGAPISYEWVNSTRLTKTREQMAMAYEYGIRKLWIVNVGDLKNAEYPLKYFMDLAYDYETWSGDDSIERYVSDFMDSSFGSRLKPGQKEELTAFVDGFTKWNAIRHPETVSSGLFHPVHFDEARRVINETGALMTLGSKLFKELESDVRTAFESMFYYAGMASLNLLTAHAAASLNRYLISKRDALADEYARIVRDAVEADKKYVADFHAFNGSKWNHMMDSAHTGFMTWNDEKWSYPSAVTLAEAGPSDTKNEAGADKSCVPGNTADGMFVLARSAADYDSRHDVNGEGWHVIKHLGRFGAAIKAYPVDKCFEGDSDIPYAEYSFNAGKGRYVITLVMMTRNPVVKGGTLRIGYALNDGTCRFINTVCDDYYTSWTCADWCEGVLSGIRRITCVVECAEGTNTLRLCPCDPNAVVETVYISREDIVIPDSYLGPAVPGSR